MGVPRFKKVLNPQTSLYCDLSFLWQPGQVTVPAKSRAAGPAQCVNILGVHLLIFSLCFQMAFLLRTERLSSHQFSGGRQLGMIQIEIQGNCGGKLEGTSLKPHV